MKTRYKMGRGRRLYRYKGKTYLNFQHGHNHLGTRLVDLETSEVIYVKQDDILRIK